MAHTLFPHQIEALERIKDNPRPALFMQMRLGKTPVIIRWAMQPGLGRYLVVAPMATLDDWADELRREGISERDIVRLDGLRREDREEQAYGPRAWYLINFEGLRICPAMADMDWDAVIVDESTSIRNPQAKITKSLVTGYQHVPRRAVMSGDPAPESPMNYFSQFHFLLGDFMGYGNFWAWRNRHFRQNPKVSWDWMPEPGVRDAIKEYVHSRAVVMTRQQYGIGGRKIYEKRVMPMNPPQRAAVKQIIKDYQFEYIETNFATVRDLWLARIAGGFSPDKENPELLSGAKTAELIALMKGELKKESVVVWFRFNEELAHVVAALRRAGIGALGITGATPKTERPKLRHAFNQGLIQVLCIQTKLGRMGWNLSRASTAIYYSNWYDWETRSQSEDRIVHPTKKNDLLYIDLVTEDTIDGEVVRLLREKRRNSAQFMRQLSSVVWAQFRGEHETKEKTQARGGKVRRHYPGATDPGA